MSTKTKSTSREVATHAAKLLTGAASQRVRSVAGSALSQTAPAKKRKKTAAARKTAGLSKARGFKAGKDL